VLSCCKLSLNAYISIHTKHGKLSKINLKGIHVGSILFFKNGLKKKFAQKAIKIISEEIIMSYVQL
jgi:hypothetical protein